MIGQTVSHYRILERLGGGGMGVVFRAEDLLLHRPVALKFLPRQVGDEADLKERFLREARAASLLDHPNICAVYGVGETDEGQLFLVMECYEGETLKKRLERGTPDVGEAVDLVRQIVAGLAKSHSLDVVHRDIKPGNVFVTTEGQVKILDFGLAKFAGEQAMSFSGLTQGTPAYMAPERITGEKTDARSDLWSVGVLLYEALAGVLPFAGENILQLVQAIHSAEPVPLGARCARAPKRLGVLVENLLRKEPQERLASCHEVLDELDAIAPSTSRFSRQAMRALGGRPGSFFRRHRRVLLGAILFALLLAGALAVWLRSGKAPASGARPEAPAAAS